MAAMSSTPSLRYLALADIGFRILTILPGVYNDPIVCILKTVHGRDDDQDQPEPKSYEALSYAWGTVAPDRTIFVDGQRFSITSTLDQALRRLRHEADQRCIWVDSICIDQTNAAEKAVQIRKMDRIFADAQQVIVWLGEEEDDSALAIDFARELSDHVRILDYSSNGYPMLPMPFTPELEQFLFKKYLPSWDALHRLLCCRAWWSRAWVVQEITVAKSIRALCGSSSIPWDRLEKAILFGRETFGWWCLAHNEPGKGFVPPNWFDEGYRPSRIVELMASRHIYHARVHFALSEVPRRLDIMSLLLYNRERLCRFDHDRVYSILALCPPAFIDSVWIDYNRPVEELFKCVVKAVIEYTGCLDIIFYAFHFPRNSTLPSWVPDWRQVGSRCVFNGQVGMNPVQPQTKISSDVSKIVVLGAKLSVVLETQLESKLLPNMTKGNSSFDSQGKLVPDGDGLRIWNFDTQELMDFFVPVAVTWSFDTFAARILSDLTLFAVLLKLMRIAKSTRPVEAELDEWYLHMDAPPQDENPEPWEENDWTKLEHRLGSSTLIGRTVVSTSHPSGLLGLAPDAAQPGDVVYWIRGCSALALLRPTGDQGAYHLVGDIFVESNQVGKDTLLEALGEETEYDQVPPFHEITLV